MDNNIAIKVNNLTKIYHLYDKPQDRLKEALNPFRKSYHRDFYALNNVSFEIKKGETVGIIGKNGAGKSTLLKIITGVLNPTNGSVEVNGKIASLLELGAGFNPEMTGLENIYLNGTLMGFSKEEMDNKIDSILEFADIGEFIYQQVKMYSSGMFARLAFSVVINVEPKILIVDEALAVGDASFVLKCMNKMNKIKEQGTTILLVTHDTQSIKTFTSKSLWISEGKLKLFNNSKLVCERYMEYLYSSQNSREKKPALINSIEKDDNFKEIPFASKRWGSKEIEIVGYKLYDDNGKQKDFFEWGENINISIKALSSKNFFQNELGNVGFGIAFRNKQGLDIITYTSLENEIRIEKLVSNQVLYSSFKIKNILKPEEYFLILAIEKNTSHKITYYDFIEDSIILKVISDRKDFYSLVKTQVEVSINES